MSQSRAGSTATLQSLLAKAQSVADDPRRFGVYRDNPIGFCKDILGVTLWAKQEEVLLSIVKHRRLAVRSGHGIGKSFVLACAVLWWLYAKQGLVVTTASSWHQVERVLWREIKNLHRFAKVPLPGTRMQTELRVEEDWWAIGLSTDNPTAFQGQHHSELLVVVDEAPGIEDDIHDAIGSLATGRANRLVYIGNPTEASGRFYEAFKPGSGWKTLHVSCLEHPNVITGTEVIPGAVTREWVEERRAEYGGADAEHDPRWQIRVAGDFPTESNRSVCPIAWLERASETNDYAMQRAMFQHHPIIFAIDVARFGINKTVIAVRQGDCVIDMIDWQGASIVESMRRVLLAMQEYHPRLVLLDDVGVGGGLFDVLVDAGVPVVGYSAGGRAARSDAYDSLRSENWFGIRDRLEHGRIWLPKHDALQADLAAPLYGFSPQGKIRVQRKDQLTKSTDFGDACMMAFSMDLDEYGRAAPAEDFAVQQWKAGRDQAILPPAQDDESASFFGGIPTYGY